jgi:hypothetical protein
MARREIRWIKIFGEIVITHVPIKIGDPLVDAPGVFCPWFSNGH